MHRTWRTHPSTPALEIQKDETSVPVSELRKKVLGSVPLAFVLTCAHHAWRARKHRMSADLVSAYQARETCKICA